MRRTTLLATAAALLALLGAATGRAAAEGRPEPDPSFDPLWCGVGGTVDVRWEDLEGAPPYTVTVGQVATVVTDAKRIELPCAEIRAQFIQGALLDHVQATLPLSVLDAAGAETRRNGGILLLASAPQGEPPSAELIVGYTDLHVRPRPSKIKPQTNEDPVPAVAIFRYRAAGSTDWIYAMPFPPGSQSSSRYSPFHASDLEPDTEYELQIAWLWYLGTPEERVHYPYRLVLDWWNSGPDWWEEQGADRWWRDWNAPEMIRWSEVQRFRTQRRSLEIAADATGDTIRLIWQGNDGGYHVTATSPDWPGVIWFDRRNAWNRTAEGGVITSTMSGLPADTEFEVQVAHQIFSGIAGTPPATVAVRTLAAVSGKTPGAADPSDIIIEPTAGWLRVEWLSHEAVYTWPSMARARRPGEPFEYWGAISDRVSTRLPGGRAEVALRVLRSEWALRLYVNRQPRGGDHATPYMCAVWDVQTPPTNADVYLDRYFVSAWDEIGQTVAPAQIADLSRSELLNHCRLADPTSA